MQKGVEASASDSCLRVRENDAVQGNGRLLSGQDSGQQTLDNPCCSAGCCSKFIFSKGKQVGEEISDHTACSSVLQNGEIATQSSASNYCEDRIENGCTTMCHCRQSPLEEDDVSYTQRDSRKDKWIGDDADLEEPMPNAKCSNQVRKIWVSSHDPVHLPGRGTLYFKCFETWRMEEFLLLTKEQSLVTGGRALGGTGGGARKFGHLFFEIAGLQLNRADELKSLVGGIDFLIRHSQHESFEFPTGSFQGGVIQRPFKSPENSSDDDDFDFSQENSSSTYQRNDMSELEQTYTAINETDRKENTLSGKNLTCGLLPRGPILTCETGGSLEGNRDLYPYLVVNIGSGVSILLVDSPEKFQRVGGTSLGGSTFFGLASILTGCNSFEEAIGLAAEGDSTEIDMLVGDIYGGDYPEVGLAATTVASSFGKLVQPARRAAALKTPQHLAKATLLMITNNIGSLAKLHAQATGVDHVMFTGSFMHGNKLAMRLLAVAMEFWSKGQIKAIFLRHEGHAGAMGALLSALDPTNPTDTLLLS